MTKRIIKTDLTRQEERDLEDLLREFDPGYDRTPDWGHEKKVLVFRSLREFADRHIKEKYPS